MSAGAGAGLILETAGGWHITHAHDMSAGDNANYVYDEVQVDAKVTNSQRSTPEEIVALAKKIWRDVQSSGISEKDDKGNDALLERLQEKYKDFSTSFPIILRWMVQMRKFNAEAMRKYLLKHATVKLDTEDAFLELQGEYLVLLYCETHKHPDNAFVIRYRQSVIKQLKEESEGFKKIQKEVDDEMKKKDAVFDHERRQALYNFMLARKVSQEQNAGKPLPTNVGAGTGAGAGMTSDS